ncbi:restriction endonuclease subunit S [Pseudomonas alvandae]|uniref:restriction endonuclease subunit S n=1 Tax=Pseudomonas canavaninivorans TaxID=2842348 RepID=UPI00216002D8|nr:restriction endonuclease subunit S [Pseudomonas canavaninivorans]UVM72070.1 restriction endonuclease subunit S [Pseudomonas canavaninivorans]
MNNVPPGWSVAKIGDICTLINGRAFKTQEWSESGLPIIRIQNLNNPNAKFNYFAGEIDSKHLIRSGDLLFAWSGTPGTSFGAHTWNGIDSALNQHIFKISFPKKLVNGIYLRYAINQKLGELIDAAQGGVGLRHISKGTFEKTEIPFPPLAEQTQIAQQLDEFLARTASVRSHTEAALTEVERFRQSILSAAVSGKLTENWRKARAIQHCWRTVKIGDIVDKIEAGKNLKCIERPPNDREFGIVKISAVTWGYYNELQSKTLPESELFQESKRINPGDFLISRANTLELLGNPVIVKNTSKNLMLSDKVLRLVMRESDKQWLKIFLTSKNGRREIESRATGSQLSMRNISQKELLDIDLPIPEQEEALEIASRLEQYYDIAEQLEKKIHLAKNAVERLPQSILTKAFAGELTSNWRKKNQSLTCGKNSSDALIKLILSERSSMNSSPQIKEFKMSENTEKLKNNKIISATEALIQAGEPLSGQHLLSAAGYPSDSTIDQMEQFFLDIRSAINNKQIFKHKRDNSGQDWFSLEQPE